jgi:hypothetical protein
VRFDALHALGESGVGHELTPFGASGGLDRSSCI